MSRGGYTPAYRPTAWVYLPVGDCTIRWQRGDKVAYIFEGKQFDTYPDKPLTVEVLATVPVPSKGWIDIAHVKRVGEGWVKDTVVSRSTCGRGWR